MFVQHRPAVVCWIPRQALHECCSEATRYFPRETGGTFMGYWANGQEAVVTRLIGPGPLAVRERHSFEPDQQWQLGEIARHYAASGRRDGYLGDWHSHPRATNGHLSCTDRAVMAKIIRTPQARAPKPISMVLHGTGSRWDASVWVASSRKCIFRARVAFERAVVNLYD